jgi:hypothetical protein
MEELNHLKKECPKCGKKHRTKCFHYNPIEKRLLCRTCNNKVGNNKWYFKNFNSRILTVSKYDMSDIEKDEFHTQLMSQGLDSYNAWKRINRDIWWLRNLRQRNKAIFYSVLKKRQEEQKQMKENKTKLLEGLGRHD